MNSAMKRYSAHRKASAPSEIALWIFCSPNHHMNTPHPHKTHEAIGVHSCHSAAFPTFS